MADRRLVLATANADKAVEIAAILGPGWHIEPRPDDLADTVEDGDTLAANAVKKASEVAAHTGLTALADDTGLFVDALDGAPGVHTARYSGPDGDSASNCAKLLQELGPNTNRRARFETVVAVVGANGVVGTRSGVVEGVIGHQLSGRGGFGYDPLFHPLEGDGRSFAQMTAEEKNAISHRARALAGLSKLLEPTAG